MPRGKIMSVIKSDKTKKTTKEELDYGISLKSEEEIDLEEETEERVETSKDFFSELEEASRAYRKLKGLE